jgi:hypothetical protein
VIRPGDRVRVNGYGTYRVLAVTDTAVHVARRNGLPPTWVPAAWCTPTPTR